MNQTVGREVHYQIDLSIYHVQDINQNKRFSMEVLILSVPVAAVYRLHLELPWHSKILVRLSLSLPLN